MTTSGDWFTEHLRARGRHEMPIRLYKFLSPVSPHYNSALESVFLKNQIYLSSRQEFNDPFDCTTIAANVEDDARVHKFMTDYIAKTPRFHGLNFNTRTAAEFNLAVQNTLEKTCDELGIYSLSEAVHHPLMWAHYGCSHKGIALIFRIGVEDCGYPVAPVIYKDAPPVVDVIEGFEMSALLHKGTAWSYELEWRIVLGQSAGSMFTLPEKALAGVVFGLRSEQKTFEHIMRLSRARKELGFPPITLWRVQAKSDYSLNFLRRVHGGWEAKPHDQIY